MLKFLGVLILLPAMGLAQQNGFVVSGAMAGIKDKSLVYLTDANNPQDTISRSVASGGKFKLTGKLSEPGFYYINFSSSQKKGLLFLDNSSASVSGNPDDIQNIKVEGSVTHKDFQVYQTLFNPLFSKLNQLGEQSKTMGMTESFSNQSNKLISQIQVAIDKFLKENKGSYITPYLVLVTAQLSEDTRIVESRYAALAPDLRESYYGKFIKSMLNDSKIGQVGSAAVDFTQNDTEGKPVSLSSFKGKYVLVDFWASWCGPCRQENPNVVNNYNTFKNKNFTVLGISLDRSREPWLKAIKDDNLTWTHVSDLKFWSNEVARKYKIESIPQNYLIDPTGKIIAKNLRGPELTQRLSELLK